MSLNTELNKSLKNSLESGNLTADKYWKFIHRLNSFKKLRLERCALIYDKEKVTYGQMFEQWENYARVFSGLGITGDNTSRVGFLSSRDPKSLYTFYGLNMTGTSVSLIHELDVIDHKRWDQMIQKERITDLILSFAKTDSKRLEFISDHADRLGLKNIIILDEEKDKSHARKYERLHEYTTVRFMSELLSEYKDSEIIYGPNKSQEGAVIFHTSGTTNGIHKPVPISDRGLNESAARLLRDERFQNLENVVTILALELTSSYGTCDMLHLPLAYGGTVVIPSDEEDNDIFELIGSNKVSVLFSMKDYFEAAFSAKKQPVLSSVEMVFLGGSYVSAAVRQKICDYLKKCGSSASVYVGYGLTEAGGAVTLSDGASDEDSIGRPLDGVKVRILDEEDGTYHDISDGPRTGVLCLSSPSVSSGKLGDTTFFELVDIDGERYLNTYDLVEVKDDGNLRIAGRMNKYFVNNEGIRFDAGLIETALGAQEAIENCALSPRYSKQLHDTIPVLYLQMKEKGSKGRIAAEDALYKVFVKDGKAQETNLPSMVVITDSLPLNSAGKVDIRAILDGKVKGKKYVIKPLRKRGRLIDVRVIKQSEAGYYYGGWIPEELEYEMELYKELYEGSDDYMERERKGFDRAFLARVIKGFLDEMAKESEGRRDDECDGDCKSCGRRGRCCKRRRPKGMCAMYNGFDDYDEDDDEEDDFEEADEDEDDDEEDDDSEGRGCSGPGRKGKSDNGPMGMMNKIGRYFNESDYDRFYED
jgi:acyl-CoA synthetase (AMP-forming)/AMP-acid ligase II